MKRHLPALLLGLGLSTATVSPAAPYPVDCAILLCLGGGFPPSVPCAQAKAEMIRRITPWPIEPPLQVWRCPMRASLEEPRRPTPVLRQAFIRSEPSIPAVPGVLHVQSGLSATVIPAASGEHQSGRGQADVDLSGPTFDFVRSIRVFSVEQAFQHRSSSDGGSCNQVERVRLGRYGAQGEFTWQRASIAELPPAFAGLSGWRNFGDFTNDACPDIALRSVFMDWRDHAGAYASEQVDY